MRTFRDDRVDVAAAAAGGLVDPVSRLMSRLYHCRLRDGRPRVGIMARAPVGDVILGNRPGRSSSWSQATGREYDIRTATHGKSDYSVTVNRDRIDDRTTGWICLRDGNFGAIAGLCAFTGPAEPPDVDRVSYAPGTQPRGRSLCADLAT